MDVGAYFQAARVYWQVTGDEAVLRQVSAYFDWLNVNGLYDGANVDSGYAGIAIPRYLTGPLIGDANYSDGDMLHCLDVAGTVGFALDAKQRLNQSTVAAVQRLAQLRACSVRTFNDWTRSTASLPKYRMQVPRTWMWWMRGRYEFTP